MVGSGEEEEGCEDEGGGHEGAAEGEHRGGWRISRSGRRVYVLGRKRVGVEVKRCGVLGQQARRSSLSSRSSSSSSDKDPERDQVRVVPEGTRTKGQTQSQGIHGENRPDSESNRFRTPQVPQ